MLTSQPVAWVTKSKTPPYKNKLWNSILNKSNVNEMKKKRVVVKKPTTIIDEYCNRKETRKNTRFNILRQCT
jgi:hypothetical protein